MLKFIIGLFNVLRIRKIFCEKTTLCTKCSKILYVGEKCFTVKKKDKFNQKIKVYYCTNCVKTRKDVLKEFG